jgi:Glycosyltransferase Family 4
MDAGRCPGLRSSTRLPPESPIILACRMIRRYYCSCCCCMLSAATCGLVSKCVQTARHDLPRSGSHRCWHGRMLDRVQAVICVSHTSKENTVLRACLPPSRVHVIPNAVDTAKFQPYPRDAPLPARLRCAAVLADMCTTLCLRALARAAASRLAWTCEQTHRLATRMALQGRTCCCVRAEPLSGPAGAAPLCACRAVADASLCACRVVVLNRMVYRKGIDLQAAIMPDLCARYPHLYFVVGGDGPKRGALEAMIEKHGLHDRIALRGAVQHEDARALLASGAHPQCGHAMKRWIVHEACSYGKQRANALTVTRCKCSVNQWFIATRPPEDCGIDACACDCDLPL